MRASTLCPVFGLVLLMVWHSEAQPAAHVVPGRCCFNFIGFKIPDNKIVSTEKTGSDCPQAGIVVTTQKGLEFCVKPDEPWIKTVMEQLEKKKQAEQTKAIAAAVPKKCCFNFIGFKIPDNKIVSAEKTGPDCPKAGIVVTIQEGSECCVKDEPWIKKVME